MLKKPIAVIATTYVKAWDHHVMQDGAEAILAALDDAGYKIVPKHEIEQMLERVKQINS